MFQLSAASAVQGSKLPQIKLPVIYQGHFLRDTGLFSHMKIVRTLMYVVLPAACRHACSKLVMVQTSSVHLFGDGSVFSLFHKVAGVLLLYRSLGPGRVPGANSHRC